MKRIPQYEPSYGARERARVGRYLRSAGWLTEFTETRIFEKMIARFVGARYCSVVSNATGGLFLVLKALGIGKGDEVIVPNLTMAANPSAVLLAGATPVLVDVDAETLCIDPNELFSAITKKTRAVMHVSLNGRAGALETVRRICRQKKIYLVEDAAQSFGSFHGGQHLGTFGTAGVFSFSMPKLLTTGQGGAIVTESRKLFERIQRLKDWGRSRGGNDIYETVGWNFKFTDLQASFGIAQLGSISRRIAQKKRVFSWYQTLLAHVPQMVFLKTDLSETTPWFIDAFVERRQSLAVYLRRHGIDTRQLYPPLHQQPAYRDSPLVKAARRYPVSEKAARQGIWLPSSLALTKREVQRICQNVRAFYHQ